MNVFYKVLAVAWLRQLDAEHMGYRLQYVRKYKIGDLLLAILVVQGCIEAEMVPCYVTLQKNLFLLLVAGLTALLAAQRRN